MWKLSTPWHDNTVLDIVQGFPQSIMFIIWALLHTEKWYTKQPVGIGNHEFNTHCGIITGSLTPTQYCAQWTKDKRRQILNRWQITHPNYRMHTSGLDNTATKTRCSSHPLGFDTLPKTLRNARASATNVSKPQPCEVHGLSCTLARQTITIIKIGYFAPWKVV